MQRVLSAFLMFVPFTTHAQQEKQRSLPSVTVSVAVNSTLPLKESFEYIVPMDLEHIFQPYKNIPGVDSTSNQGAWYTPGMKRTVYFDDGSSSDEYLLTLTPHSGFSYKVNGFTNSLKHLIKQINGSWTFVENEQGNIEIAWTYEFVPRHGVARFLINAVVKKRIRVPMTRALNIMKEELESGNLYQYERKIGNW